MFYVAKTTSYAPYVRARISLIWSLVMYSSYSIILDDAVRSELDDAVFKVRDIVERH